MLRKDKISSRGAPSLLTSAQQAEAERNRILSTLEASDGERKRAPKTAPAAGTGAPARTPWTWLTFGVLVAVIAGGGGLWYGQQSAATPPLLAAATPQAEPASVMAPVSAGASASAAADPAPSAATIQDDHVAQAEPGASQSMGEMLEAPSSHAAPAAHAGAARHDVAPGAGGDLLSQALEAPSATALAAAAAAAPPAAKAAARPAHTATPAKPKPAVKRVAARKAAPAAQDSDAMLLSALIAHADAAEATPKKARPSLEQELKACRKQPKAGLTACRERACEGRSNVGLCKVQR